MDVNRLPVDHGAGGGHTASDTEQACRRRYRTMLCHYLEAITDYAIDESVQCVAQPRCILGNHIQHRLDIRRRAGDYTQDLACRGPLGTGLV